MCIFFAIFLQVSFEEGIFGFKWSVVIRSELVVKVWVIFVFDVWDAVAVIVSVVHVQDPVIVVVFVINICYSVAVGVPVLVGKVGDAVAVVIHVVFVRNSVVVIIVVQVV